MRGFSGILGIRILGVLGLEMHSSCTEVVTFLEAKFLFGGHNSRLGGTSSELVNLGGTAPEYPSASPGLVLLQIQNCCCIISEKNYICISICKCYIACIKFCAINCLTAGNYDKLRYVL